MKNLADRNAISRALMEIWDKVNRECLMKSRGTSMLPLIEEGSEVTIQYTPPKDIKVGDIVAFMRSAHIVIHRVIRKYTFNGKVYFIEKGDNTFDSTAISEDVIIGKVIQIKRTNTTIKLDQGFWAMISQIMGIYGYISNLIFNKACFIKNKLAGKRKIFFTTLGYRGFKIFTSGVSIILINVGHIFQKRIR